jgi:hypothetical protein
MTQRLWSQEGQDVAEYAVILAVVVPARGSHSATHRHEFNEYILRCWKFNHTIVHDSNMGALEKHCPRLSLNVTTVFAVLPSSGRGVAQMAQVSAAGHGLRRRFILFSSSHSTLTIAPRMRFGRLRRFGLTA